MLVKVQRKSVQISNQNYLSFTRGPVKELQVREGELFKTKQAEVQDKTGRSEAIIIMQWKGAR